LTFLFFFYHLKKCAGNTPPNASKHPQAAKIAKRYLAKAAEAAKAEEVRQLNEWDDKLNKSNDEDCMLAEELKHSFNPFL
jgi:hypothetical protein